MAPAVPVSILISSDDHGRRLPHTIDRALARTQRGDRRRHGASPGAVAA
jgi:hypothetical protein